MGRKEYSDETLQEALKKKDLILNSYYIKELRNAVIESEKLLHNFHAISMKRNGAVELLESTTISTIESGMEPTEMINQLRVSFRNVIDMMKQDTANLERLTKTDQLTGLGNRRSFDEFLRKKLTAAKDFSPISLPMINIDHFKEFNDNYATELVIRTCRPWLK